MKRHHPHPNLLTLVVCVAAISSLPVGASAQQAYESWQPTSWWLHLRTTVYSFESAEISGAELDRLGGYQHYDGTVTGLAGGHLSLRAAGRFADDLSLKQRVTDRERLYVAYAQFQSGRALRARLGRQFLQEGPTSVTVDGLWLKTRPGRRWTWRAWAGAVAPASRIYEAADLSENATWGTRITFQLTRDVLLGASWAHRERDDRVATQLLGGEATARLPGGLHTAGRAAYDVEAEDWHRAQVLARWQPRQNLPVFSVQFVDRRPAIDASSYFARFSSVERARLARASVRYLDARGIGAEVEYFGSFVDERTSTRLGLSVLTDFGRVGYSVRLGDAGEENRFFGDASYEPLTWLSVGAGAAVATYALLEDAPESEERDLTTAYARIRARVREGVRLTVEVQTLDNPWFDEDFRLLAGLDLLGGNGASRLGWWR